MSDLDEIRQAQEAILDEFYGCEEDAVEELMLERMENARLRAKLAAISAYVVQLRQEGGPVCNTIADHLTEFLHPEGER